MAAKRREDSEEGSVNSHKAIVFLSPSHPPFLLKYYHQPLHFMHHLSVFLPQIIFPSDPEMIMHVSAKWLNSSAYTKS